MKKAFTLVELVVAVTISAIILLFLMMFISDTFLEMSYSSKKTQFLTSFYQVESLMKELKGKYLSGSVLVNNPVGVGSDIILLRTLPTEAVQKGYIFALVDTSSSKIDTALNIPFVKAKFLGYRKLSSTEIAQVSVTPLSVYNYTFQLDEVFPDITYKDFQVESYNTGSLFDINLFMNLDYNPTFDGQKYSDIGTLKIERFSFTF